MSARILTMTASVTSLRDHGGPVAHAPVAPSAGTHRVGARVRAVVGAAAGATGSVALAIPQRCAEDLYLVRWDDDPDDHDLYAHPALAPHGPGGPPPPSTRISEQTRTAA